MKHWILVVALLCVARVDAAVAAPAPAQPVLLRPSVVVEDAVVRLDDIFDGLGENGATAVARAPRPGNRITLDVRWLASVARAYGVAWRPRSLLDVVVVERSSQVIDNRHIEPKLLDLLADRDMAGDITLLLDNPALRLHLPVDSDGSIAVSGFVFDPTSGRFEAIISSPAQGRPLATVRVTGRAIRMIEVPVPLRRISRGEIIRHQDITWLRVRADRLGRNVLMDSADIVGKSPRRSLRPSEIVRTIDLREPVLVPKNSLVIIELKTDRMFLTVRGRALDDGAAGQVIRVMNTKSNSIINGVVARAGTVVVSQTTTIN